MGEKKDKVYSDPEGMDRGVRGKTERRNSTLFLSVGREAACFKNPPNMVRKRGPQGDQRPSGLEGNFRSS